MEIQSNATAASLFESLSQKEGAGAKGDMFASMMNRILTEAANRKHELAEAQARAEAADRKAPVRADRPKPRQVDAGAQPPRAPEKVEPPPAKDRPEPKAEAKAKDDTPPRPEKAEAPQRDQQAPKADKAERAGKKDAADGSRKTEGAAPKDAPAAGTEKAPQDGNAKVAADGDVQDDASQDPAEGDELIVIDAEVTITETTIEVVTDEGAFALAMTEQAATLGIEGAADGSEQAAADALTAISGDANAAQPATPAAQLAAAQAAQAAQAAAQAPQDAAAAGADASKATEAVHAVKPGEAVPLETMPGDLAADVLPKTDDDAPLPGNLAELAAAAKKGLDKSGAKGDGDAGARSDGQNQGGNPALAQLQTQSVQTGESAKSTAETAFTAAVAAAADVPARAPALADDADRLLEELGARERGALPGAGRERRVGCGDVTGEAQDVADRELGGRDDVGGRGVHDHDAGARGGLDVDVVEAHAGTGDHLQRGRRGDRLCVHLRRGADEDHVRLREGREERGAVGAVHVTDLEVGAEGLDRGGGQFFSDQDDRLGHGRPSGCERGWAAASPLRAGRGTVSLARTGGPPRRRDVSGR